MRILYVSSSYFPHINGVYYFVGRIGPLLQDKGHTVAVIAPSETTHSSRKKIDGLDVIGIPSYSIIINPTIRLPFPFLLKRRLKKIIENFKPDIIHVQDHFPLSKAVVNLNKKLKIPILGSNHFMPENFTFLFSNKYLKNRFESYLWNSFSKVFNQMNIVTTPTETGARLIRPRLKVKAIAISSGINFNVFNPHGNIEEVKKKYNLPQKPILLYVGRLDPEKHIEEILKAVAVAVSNIDFCFVVVGKGTSKTSLEKLSNQLNIAAKTIFAGFVPDEELPFFYKLSRCFVIASIAELLSLGVLQAMASGLPVIAVNAGALPELVKNKINGYLYEEGNVQALSKHIEDIMTRDDLYEKMRLKSLEFVQHHNIDQTADSFEKLYKEQAGKI
jgi:1,2-diacylglycerol 3-alpha-glucosyltransferase